MKKRIDLLLKRGILTLTMAIVLAGSPSLAINADAASWYNSYSMSTSTIRYSLETARTLALNRAGVSKSKVTFTEAKTEYESDYRAYVHEFEFYSASYKYEVEINASTGAVLKYKRQARTSSTPSNPGTSTGTGTGSGSSSGALKPGSVSTSIKYSLETARTLALNRAGVSKSKVTFTEAKTEYESDYRAYVHEFEFYSASYKYEVEVNASTGAILKYKRQARTSSTPSKPGTSTGTGTGSGSGTNSGSSYQKITLAKAKEIAVKRAGLSNYFSRIRFEEAKLDGSKYEIEFKYGGYEYDVEINAYTGTVIKYERERD